MMSSIRARSISLLVFVLLIITISVCEGQGVAISLDPILVERTVRAGETIEQIITVDNLDKYAQAALAVSVADIEEDIAGVYALVAPGSTACSIARSIDVNPTQLVIPPGGSAEVMVKISVPRGSSGGKYGAVVLTVLPDKIQEHEDLLSTSQFYFQMASFFELIIEGSNVQKTAYLDSFYVASSGDFPQLQSQVGENAVVFTATVANEGNIHVTTTGSLLVTTTEGRTVARYPLGGGRGVILPGSIVALQTVVPGIFREGEYVAKAVIDYGGRRPLVSSTGFEIDKTAVWSGDAELSQTPLSRFSVSPGDLEVSLRPGAFQNAVLEVTNSGEEPINLEAYVLPLEFDLLGDLVSEEKRAEPVSWIELNPREFSVAPGRTHRIRLTLSPPRDLQTSYFADILFRSVGEGSHVQTGINLLATLGDDLEKSGNVEIVKVDEADGGLAVDALFVNEGAAAVRTDVELVMNRMHPQVEGEEGRIIPARAETIASVELPTSENPVLPGTERLFSFMIPSGLEIGEYEFAIRVDYGGEGPAIGRLAITVGGQENE